MSITPDQAAAPASVAEPSASRRPGGLALVVLTALTLAVAVNAWLAFVWLDRASFVSRVLDHVSGLTASDAARHDDRLRAATTATQLTFVVTAAVFIAWFAIVVRRLHAARPAAFRYGPGWAIGGWFVPVMSLFQPKQMVDDAWEAATDSPKVPLVVHLWWVLLLFGNATTYLGRLIPNSDRANFRLLPIGDRVGAAGAAMLAVGGILAIAVVAMLDVMASRVDPAPPASDWQGSTLTFNPPPGWPAPPPGWMPPPGWQPDPAWPPAPADWPFWTPTRRG